MTAKPTRKVTASTLGGAVAVLLVFIVGLLGVSVTAEVASSLTLVCTFLAGYVVKEREET